MLDLVFWMNMPSFYQADLFRALLRRPGVRLKAIFAERIPEDRVKLGWQDDLEGFEHEFLNQSRPVTDALLKSFNHRRDINIVSGLWAGKITETVLAAMLLSRARYYIYTEAPDARNEISPLKLRLARTLGTRVVRHAAGLLPISHFAREYLESYGAEESKLHPFAYFRKVPAPQADAGACPPKTTVDILYVGQLVHRKGLDILLAAMEPLFAQYTNLHLQLIGSGEMRGELEKWTVTRGLSGRVKFEGALNPRQITERISKSDALVLPSRWDGWGLVVNEALMTGVPVIVSDMCGAADVVRGGINGFVFRSEDVQSLKNKLESLFKHPGRGDDTHRASVDRVSLADAARETGAGLDPDIAAEYLLRVIQGDEIQPGELVKYPWVVAKP